MKYTPDYSSRFRILKGGKISLVVSAMLIGSVANVANADPIALTGTTPYTTPLAADTDFAIVDLDTSAAGASAFDIDADGSNTHITLNSATSEEGINVNYVNAGSPKESLSGINIINLGTGGSSITTTNNYLNVRNTTGEAFGITSKNGGLAGDWENMTINVVSADPDMWHGIFATGVGYAEGIYVDGSFTTSSITNDQNSYFDVSSGNVSQTVPTEAFGIDIGGDLVSSTITNDGQFWIDSNYKASGIAAFGTTTNSQIENNGLMNIATTRTETFSSDIGADAGFALRSTGILVEGILTSTVDGSESTITNNDQIHTNSTFNIKINEYVENYDNLIASAKGISVYELQGHDSESTSDIINTGTINVESKLNLTFDEINGGELFTSYNEQYGQTYANSVGIEIGNSSYGKIGNTGDIISLAQVEVAEEGTVYGYNTYALSSGIKTENLHDTEILSYGNIDSLAVFNGTSYGWSRSFGIYVDGDVEDSFVASMNLISRSHATATAGSAYADADGIHIRNDLRGVNGTALLGNGGLLEVESVSNASNYSSAYTYGISVNGDVSHAMIMNVSEGQSAELTVTATANSTQYNANAEAVGIYAGYTDYAAIMNDGNIEVTAEASGVDEIQSNAIGIQINGVYGDGAQIFNTGTVTAKADGTASGEDPFVNLEAYGIKVGFDEQSALSINNEGTIEAYINDKLDRNGYSLYIDGDGYDNEVNIVNSATGVLKGNIRVDGTLENSGTIELAHNAMGEDSAYIQNFTNMETGKLTVGLLTDGTLENTTYSQLHTENAEFKNGSTINVNVMKISDSDNVALLAGNRLESVVTARTALTINGTLNVTDNSELLKFKYVTDGLEGEDWINGGSGAIHLDIVKASENNIIDSTIAGQGNNNAQSAAIALQQISTDPAMSNYIAALNTLGTAAEVAHAVASTTPQATTAATGANTQIMNGIQGIVEMRQNSVMGNGGMNSGDIALRDQNLWIKPFGSRGSQDNKDGINGFDVKAYGFGMGYDAEISPKQRLGAAFFYTDAKVDVNGMPQTSDVNVYTALVYGNVPVNTNTDFLYQTGYSWQKTKSERTVLPTYDHAKADFTSKTASLDLKLMQNYKIDNALSIRPLVETTYRHNTTPSYTESGAGAMNLSVQKFTSTQLIAGTGAIVDYKLGKESKLVSELHLGYDLHHDSQSVTASYAGAAGVTFSTDGIDNGGWQYNAGLGYEMTNILGGEFNFMYNYQGQGNSFANHTLSAKYIWKF